jgi:hypothetical protein
MLSDCVFRLIAIVKLGNGHERYSLPNFLLQPSEKAMTFPSFMSLSWTSGYET